MKHVFMAWLWKNKLVVLFCISFFCVKAQEVAVKDTALAKALCQHFPLAMSSDCKTLDTVLAKLNYSSSPLKFEASVKKIVDVSELKYFNGLDSIYMQGNQIKQFLPLSTFPNLNRLHLSSNEMTEAPIINYSGNGNLKFVFIHNNKIKSLPVDWFTKTSKFWAINISGNEIDTIPDFTKYPTSLNSLIVYNNRLGFGSLVLNKDQGGNNLELFPQKKLALKLDPMFDFGQQFTLNIPKHIAGNINYVFKEDVLIDSTRNAVYSIASLNYSHQGKYKIMVRNDNFTGPNEFLESEEFEIKVNSFSETQVKDFKVFSPDGDGIGDEIKLDGSGSFTLHTLNGKVILNGTLPFTWNGQDQFGKIVPPELYFLKNNDSIIKILINY